MRVNEPRRITAVKKQVDGGKLFRSSLGSWTFRLDRESSWRQVYLDTEEQAMNALKEARNA